MMDDEKVARRVLTAVNRLIKKEEREILLFFTINAEVHHATNGQNCNCDNDSYLEGDLNPEPDESITPGE